MNSIIITALFSGIIGAVIASVISGLIQHKHFTGALTEKWICELRDEIAKFIGLIEKTKFNPKSLGMSKVSLQSLHAQKQKIRLLLNDDLDQAAIFQIISELVGAAEKANGLMLNMSSTQLTDQLVAKSRDIFSKYQREISTIRWSFGWTVIVLAEAIIFIGLICLTIQSAT